MPISLSDMLTAGQAPVDWLVRPLMAKEERIVICGEWSAYKSWILLHLGLHLSTGAPWLGYPTTPSRVLYIDEEMHLQTLARRLRLLSNGLGIESTDCEHLPFYVTSREGLSVHDASPQITGYDVVIVESLRRVLVGNENQACDIAAFWRNATRIFKGSTLLLSHHMNKPTEGARSRDRASGSTDIMAGCDAAFAVTRTGTSSARIECVRSRVAEEAPSFSVKVQGIQDSLLITRT